MDQIDKDKIKESVQRVLSPDLLKPYWRKQQEKTGNKFTGHCYAATEACFHLLGGYNGKFKSYILTHKSFPEELKEGETHWFLKSDDGELVDPTEKQFNHTIPYEKGRRQAFLTKMPSKRAKTIIERIQIG